MSAHFNDTLSAHGDAESRMGVEPIDDLLAERASLVDQLAPMWAEYGPGGVGEHRLSAERNRIVGLLRAMAAADDKKITEAALEAGSRAHPDYLNLMAKQTTERATFFRLQEQMRAVDFRINRGQSLLRAYASEPR
jgi:hypothetical protein